MGRRNHAILDFVISRGLAGVAYLLSEAARSQSKMIFAGVLFIDRGIINAVWSD